MLDLDAPAPVPECDAGGDPRAKIAVAHLLHMSSGLERKGAGSYPVYYDGADAVQEITAALLETDPGTRWSYANRDTLLLVRAMRKVLGDEAYWRFPIRELLDRIGMHSTVPETDAHGNYVLSSQVLLSSWDVRFTANPVHLRYQDRLEESGRYFGELRMGFEYEGQAGPLFSFLYVDPETLAAHAAERGWSCDVLVREEDGNYLGRLSSERSVPG